MALSKSESMERVEEIVERLYENESIRGCLSLEDIDAISTVHSLARVGHMQELQKRYQQLKTELEESEQGKVL